jgi:mannose-6-phosphate isomerase-like protein (cupin superfamily)
MITEEDRYLKDESFVVRPGDGTVVGRGGYVVMEIKVRSEQTGGAWALVEAVVPPESSGPPLHINTQEDETFYVLEGAILLQLGERKVSLTQGCVGYVPKGSVHTFCNPYKEPARFLGFIAPGGFERFFEETAELQESTPAGEQPDMGKLMALSRKYGGVMVGPPIRE